MIDRLVVAHYPSNACELEDDLVHMMTSHDAWYVIDFTSTTMEADLSEAEEADGNRFPGITEDGTWIVALFCTSCGNPAPWFMSVLTPC